MKGEPIKKKSKIDMRCQPTFIHMRGDLQYQYILDLTHPDNT